MEGPAVTPAELRTQEAILKAAAELFAERGYRGTTTRALAERAGVNEVTIFRRFKNKQGVLAALGASFAERSAGVAVAATPDPEDTRATLRHLARQETAQTAEFGAVALRIALDAGSDPEVAAVMGDGPRGSFDGLVAYLIQRQEAGDLRADLDARALAEAFFCLSSTFIFSRLVLGATTTYELPIAEAADQLFDLFMSGATAGVAPRGGEGK
jgi:AcrR family transcriptional regulator